MKEVAMAQFTDEKTEAQRANTRTGLVLHLFDFFWGLCVLGKQFFKADMQRVRGQGGVAVVIPNPCRKCRTQMSQ
jgi:hypothetical protein